MAYELVHTDVEGGRLHGLLSHPKRRRRRGLAIHVHGTWGNFYGNDVVAEIGRVYNERGYSFLAANFTGHDETAVFEEFETFPASLRSWISTVGVSGRLILQGHSLGALKLLYMHTTGVLKTLDPFAICFLSPFDSVAFYEREASVVDGNVHAYAQRLVDTGGPRTLVPESVFSHWQISAATLLAATTVAGSWDQFQSRNGLTGAVGAICKRTAVLIGSSDFASFPDPPTAFRLLQSLPEVRSIMIEGAPHNFAGTEPEVCRFVARWLAEMG